MTNEGRTPRSGTAVGRWSHTARGRTRGDARSSGSRISTPSLGASRRHWAGTARPGRRRSSGPRGGRRSFASGTWRGPSATRTAGSTIFRDGSSAGVRAVCRSILGAARAAVTTSPPTGGAASNGRTTTASDTPGWARSCRTPADSTHSSGHWRTARRPASATMSPEKGGPARVWSACSSGTSRCTNGTPPHAESTTGASTSPRGRGGTYEPLSQPGMRRGPTRRRPRVRPPCPPRPPSLAVRPGRCRTSATTSRVRGGSATAAAPRRRP
mmetsp:Transcript_3697/g.7699  ORF Transcript_3697/g.7699 Transcript_3697/m.7699 type:complete len:270 (+) Transcript_3697:583-1392(+)